MALTKQLRFAPVPAPEQQVEQVEASSMKLKDVKKLKDASKKLNNAPKKLTGPGIRRTMKLAHRSAAAPKSILKTPTPSPPSTGDSPPVDVRSLLHCTWTVCIG
jgi:hypothetical protein